ncbi:MAG: prepilin peptidase [Alphaproteobacteria bacterium]|nr:prepilin peptidase [Alphaproteobacteria bacterium]
MSIQDIRSRTIGVMPLTIFSICSTLVCTYEQKYCFTPFLILLLIGIIFVIKNKKHAIGFGDYVFMFFISFFIQNDMWPLFLITCGILGIIANLFSKNNNIPFIPIIFLSAIISKCL